MAICQDREGHPLRSGAIRSQVVSSEWHGVRTSLASFGQPTSLVAGVSGSENFRERLGPPLAVNAG